MHIVTRNFLADRTACYTVWSAIGIIMSSVSLKRCALWLSGSVYTAINYTSVFIAGKFLLVPSDTFAVVPFSHKTHGKNESKKTQTWDFSDRQSGAHWSCYVVICWLRELL